MESAIYYIQNMETKKIYVGSAVSISRRWSLHRLYLTRRTHCNPHLQSAWNKYGEDSFIFGIIEKVDDKNKLLEREQHWIDYYKSFDREKGYNLAPTAGSMLGFKHSEESKKNRKNVFVKGFTPWNKGKKMEGEYRENFLRAMRSDAREKIRRKKSDGFRHTEEAKRKIGDASSKRRVSEETKKKMSQSMLGRKLGEEHRENCIKAWKIRKQQTKKKED